MHAGHLAIAAGLDQQAVKLLIKQGNRLAVVQALLGLHQPGATELQQGRVLLELGAQAQAPHRLQLQHGAQVVELLEALELQRADLPATAKVHLHLPLALQAIQRLAHRRAAGRHALGDVALAEAIARQQAEFEDVLLELLVDGISQARRRAATGHGIQPC